LIWEDAVTYFDKLKAWPASSKMNFAPREFDLPFGLPVASLGTRIQGVPRSPGSSTVATGYFSPCIQRDLQTTGSERMNQSCQKLPPEGCKTHLPRRDSLTAMSTNYSRSFMWSRTASDPSNLDRASGSILTLFDVLEQFTTGRMRFPIVNHAVLDH
jgi:hypothetical protein